MTDSASQSLVERLPELPDDHSDLTPELALKVVGKYRELLSQQAARITELEAERDRLANRLDLLAVGFGVCDGGKYIADWQAKIAHFKCALAAESDLSRVRDELDTSNNNHRAMARQMAELGARCKHAESELSRVEVERNEFRAALKGLSDMYGSTWDRVDGALMMMDSGVKRFEKAHAIAYKLLQSLPASPPPQPINAPNTEGKRMSTPPFNVNTGSDSVKTAESSHSPSTLNAESELSDETKAALKEIDDNRRNAALNAHTLIAGAKP